jgi:hypothetical protein
LLAHGPWFFPGNPASSTTKAGRHDIAEILLKVVLKHKKIKIIKYKINQKSKMYLATRNTGSNLYKVQRALASTSIS